MSKVPERRVSKIPPPKGRRTNSLESENKYTVNPKSSDFTSLINQRGDQHSKSDTKSRSCDENISKPFEKRYFSFNRELDLSLPKINISGNNVCDKIVQNPRILDLRNKLNEINKKRERDVDKDTKTLINDITQQFECEDEPESCDSGPYSLLLDLNSTQISSDIPLTRPEEYSNKLQLNSKSDVYFEQPSEDVTSMTAINRRPYVVEFEAKTMNELEYSCEKLDTRQMPNAQSHKNRTARSDLSLHLINTTKRVKVELPSPVTENSLHRPIDEHSLDDSLGILTPDQMDDMFSPTVEGLPVFHDETKISPDNGDTPSTEKTNTDSPVSTMYLDREVHMNVSSKTTEPVNPKIKVEAVGSVDWNSFELNNQCMKTKGLMSVYEPSIEQSSSDVAISMDPNVLPLEESQDKEVLVDNEWDVRKNLNFVPNIEDDLLPSVHSSILEPLSSLIETTMNLDLTLDSKHFENMKVNSSLQRIDQTPSPEDLPLDTSDLHCENTQLSNSQVSVTMGQDTQTFSDSKMDFAKSIESPKVSNSFITSITSITSLDGYQGDGEMSRPVSRGADPAGNKEDVIDWQNVPVNRRPDPMTDSDFFTESDADAHDDLMHRGDRRAQVIDGALYGGKNNSPPLIVNRNDDSCMDSSGVYTDLETHRSSPVLLNAIDDLSPEGSLPSTRSECSQRNGNSFNGERKESVENAIIPSRTSICSVLSQNADMESLSQNEVHVEARIEKPKEEKRNFSLKKYKMPKRDVPSKLKSMLSRKPDSDTSVENSPSGKTKKIDRREIIPKKTNIDSKIKSFKDIKSKVDCCFSLQRSQTACSVTRMLNSKSPMASKPKTRHMRSRLSELGAVGQSGKSSLHSSQSDISAASSPLAKPSSRFPMSRTAKKRDSAVSGSGGGAGGVTSSRAPASPPAQAPPPPQSTTHAKKNGVPAGAAVPKLPASPAAARPRPAPPSPRKPAQRRVLLAPSRPNTLPAPVKEPTRGLRSGKRGPGPQATPPAAAPAPLASPGRSTGTAPPALAHAAKGVEALGVLVQYLVCQLESLNGGGWREEAARWRALAAAERTNAARASHDHQQRAQKDLDTIGECLRKISSLELELSQREDAYERAADTSRHSEERCRSALADVAELAADIRSLKSTISSVKAEVSESRGRLVAGADRERCLLAELAEARRDLAAAGATQDSQSDWDKDKTELVAEVRSLRAVLELKQAESSELRHARSSLASETERRAAAERELDSTRQASEELRERAAARQRDVDALREETRRLRETAARDQQALARLSLVNEELRYKLRQKSQVVSLLAAGGGLDRYTSPRTRTASCGSPPPSPPSPAASPSPPSTPAVKGVVEKQDSVSWVLEIEESPEEVATRLARRSNSFRSPGGGVKRRGGGSPGSPAPASPAPNASKLFRCSGERTTDLSAPPLKESAGEAIYIYDNRQF